LLAPRFSVGKIYNKFITESRRDGARTLYIQEPIAPEGMTR
jgi:hypothetical protein